MRTKKKKETFLTAEAIYRKSQIVAARRYLANLPTTLEDAEKLERKRRKKNRK